MQIMFKPSPYQKDVVIANGMDQLKIPIRIPSPRSYKTN